MTFSLLLTHHPHSHIDSASIRKIFASNVLEEIEITSDSSVIKNCLSRTIEESYRFLCTRFSDAISRKPLKIFNSGELDPLETSSIGGLRYFIKFIEAYSKLTVMFTMRKSSVKS